MPGVPKILVVDDLNDMRIILRLTLEKSGWQVIEAEDGLQAVEITQKEHPDVIIMDYNMPQMDGVRACKTIKAESTLAKIPILIYTGAFSATVRDAALEAGASAFLTKPILPTELREKVSAAYQDYLSAI